MRKEVGYAITAGILLGLVVAYGVYRINSKISKSNTVTVTTTASPSPATSINKEFKIVLDKPADFEVVSESTVEISGITKANVWVAVSGEGKDFLVKSDTSGGFKKVVDLVPGVNQIKLTAFDDNGVTNTHGVLIVYSSAFADQSESATSSSQLSETEIKAKAEKDLMAVANKPKAFIGTVTDATGNTLELKDKSGDIKQISINLESTDVINTAGTNNKPVKTTDIAIGDYIVAMGYVNENSVLTSTRILIADPVTEPKLTVNQGKIAKIAKNEMVVMTVPDSTSKTITIDAKTIIKTLKAGEDSILKSTALSENDTIIFYEKTDEKEVIKIRTIILIPVETSPQP